MPMESWGNLLGIIKILMVINMFSLSTAVGVPNVRLARGVATKVQ